MIELLLYSGITLIILGVILWIFCEYKLQNIRDKQKKLHQSFVKNKNSIEYSYKNNTDDWLYK